MTVAWALLIIRVVAGLTLAAHGAQKALGLFGGPGFARMEQGFEKQGFRPARLWVALVILGELGGGLSLAFGFLTPLGAAGALGAMAMAARTHWKNGFFNTNGGFEFPLALLAISVAIGIAGPGAYSLDSLFNIHFPLQVFAVLAVAALLVDVAGVLIVRAVTTSAAATASRAHPA